MPLPDIATIQPTIQNVFGALSAQHLLYGNISKKFTSGKEKRFASSWKVSLETPRRLKFKLGYLGMQGTYLIKAIATIESKYLIWSQDGCKNDSNLLQLSLDSNPESFEPQSSSEDFAKIDARERLRRMRISQANKGNVPWNKGRKHSAETLWRIRVRTKQAMQDPKVKLKLVNLGHAQSEETRIKIGIGVRMGWQRRREKLMLQETCYFEWQNLIAEASRRGYAGEEELEWNSYEMFDEQLEREWLESIERRKSMPRLKGSKRAPKSPEQRRKISEAISAKWADPGYRERVCSALAKYHGTPVGDERKPRRRLRDVKKTKTTFPVWKKSSESNNYAGNETRSQTWGRLIRSNAPSYKDPLANSKLQMIRNIRSQREAAETKKREAMDRAKLLIVEAEKAMKALEIAAMKSPVARSSLGESRKLIAEAIRSIEAIEMGKVTSDSGKNGVYLPFGSNKDMEMGEMIDCRNKNSSNLYLESNKIQNHLGTCVRKGGPNRNMNDREINGIHDLSSSIKSNDNDFKFGKFSLQDLQNKGEEPLLPTSSGTRSFWNHFSYVLQSDSSMMQSHLMEEVGDLELNGAINYERTPLLAGGQKASEVEKSSNSSMLTKKWVCGKLVEVARD